MLKTNNITSERQIVRRGVADGGMVVEQEYGKILSRQGRSRERPGRFTLHVPPNIKV